MKIMISGSHGLIGSALIKQFSAEGHEIVRLARNAYEEINFSGVGAVIHLAGESIAEGRWNPEKKRRIEESRVGGTKKLADTIAASSAKPGLFISSSAIGIYGNRAAEDLTEESRGGSDFLSGVCTKWEQSTRPASDCGVRTVNIRTGIVLDTQGGALSKMLPPFKMGLGGIIGDGSQYMSWISLSDILSAISYIIKNTQINGPVNMVAPTPVTNQQFTKTLGSALKRPTLFPMPAFAARLIFGEMADALLLSSTRVKPQKLMDNGYPFIHEELKLALEDILK